MYGIRSQRLYMYGRHPLIPTPWRLHRLYGMRRHRLYMYSRRRLITQARRFNRQHPDSSPVLLPGVSISSLVPGPTPCHSQQNSVILASV